MKGIYKKIITLLSVAVLSFAFLGILSLTNFNSQKALGEVSEPITINANNEASKGFEMVKGASVYKYDSGDPSDTSNRAGIRWETHVSDEFMEYLNTAYPSANFTFGTLITGENMLAGGDVTNITHDLKKPSKPEENACKDTTSTVVDNVYYGNILYNNAEFLSLTEQEKRNCYFAELLARAYVKIETQELTSYIYAKSNDNKRSMSGVANEAYLCGEFDDAIDEENGYLKSSTKIEQAEISYYNYFNNANEIELPNEVPDGNYIAYVNARKVSVATVSNHKVVLDLSAFEKGKTVYHLNLIDKNRNVYTIDFRIPNAIISTMAELEDAFVMSDYASNGTLTKKNDGYYVLNNDLDGTDYLYGTQGYISTTFDNTKMRNVGFTGIFDGNGHTINNLTFGNLSTDSIITSVKATASDIYKDYTYSLFGIIDSGAVIKNVGITGVNFAPCDDVTRGTMTTLATWISGGTFENVCIQIDELASGMSRATAGLAYGIYYNGYPTGQTESVTMNNVIVEITSNVTPTGAGNSTLLHGALACRRGANYTSYEPDSFNNVVVISSLHLMKDTGVVGSNSIDAENTSAELKLSSVSRFESYEAMKESDYDISSFNNSNWKVIDGILYWNTVKPVIEKDITVEISPSKQTLSTQELQNVFGDQNAVLSNATSLTGGYTVNFDNGNILITRNDNAPFNGETIKVSLQAQGVDAIYNINVLPITKVISTFEDLSVFCLDQTDYGNTSVTVNRKIDGYYVLGGDIDGTGKTLGAQGYIASSGSYQTSNNNRNEGFVGTFDGRGYTISNVTFDSGNPSGSRAGTNGYNDLSMSLFGFIGKDAVVKNFAMTNIKYRIHKSSDNQPINSANCAALAYYVMSSATIENVYLDTYGIVEGGHIDYTTLSGLATRIHDGATMNNVVVKMILGNDISLDVKTTGSICALYTDNGTNFNLTKNVTNTYVISNKGLGNISGTTARFDASNLGTEAIQQCTCIIRYLDETVYTSDDLEKFSDSEYWTIQDNKIVWGN